MNRHTTPHFSTKSPVGQEVRPSGASVLGSSLLELSCFLAGAKRAAIFRVNEAETRFEAGYRMSFQLGLALIPQLNLKQDIMDIQTVVIGLKTYKCLVLHLSATNLNSRCCVVLFEADHKITHQALGRLEGVFQSWWQTTALLPTISPTQPLVHACSACQQIMAADGTWISWEDFLQRELGHGLSHGLCNSCCDDLYGENITHHWDSCGSEGSIQSAAAEKRQHQLAAKVAL